MASLQIRSLKLFCDIVRKRSFSLAASEHGLTQSAASQMVQHLEEFLDVQLIDRSKRPLVLTDEGQKFYDGVAVLIRQFDSLVEGIRQRGEEVNGQVVVASIYSLGLSYMPKIEEDFRKRYPAAQSTVHLAHPHEVYQMVEQGTVDFGLVSFPESSKTIQAIQWRDERMVLVASPRHRLATDRVIDVSELSQCALIAFAPNLRIREEIDRRLRSHGVSMRIVVELDNIDSVKHAVVVNSGLAFLPEPTVQSEVASGTLRIIQCQRLKLTRPLGIIQRRHVAMSRAARGLLELLLQSGAMGKTAQDQDKSTNDRDAESITNDDSFISSEIDEMAPAK